MAIEKRPKRATPAGADRTDDRDAVEGATVRHITSAGHAGGRTSARGYDPSTGKESTAKGYKPTATRESTGEFDVFTLVDSNTYSEARFYMRSVNADGHGERMQVRVPQGIDSQMHAAVAEIPEYRTMQDLIRDAVVHRLEYLQKRYSLGDGARRMLELERYEADSEARVREVQELSATIASMDEKLGECFTAKDWQMFALELQEGAERTEWLREPYKGRAEAMLKEWKARGAEHLLAREVERDRDRDRD